MKEDIQQPTSLLCYWSNLKKHPKCIHGPALLFGRQCNGEVIKFYACSACRDRKLCSFYAEYGQEITKKQKFLLEQDKKKNLPSYPHQKLFIHYNQLMTECSAKRAYCDTCEKLIFTSEKEKHIGHDIIENLTDYQMTHPSEIIKPLENSRKEAQYLFSKKAVSDIIGILTSLNAENVLCIGTPRIHEYITNNLQGKMSSLLLDFDGRFHNFFGPLNYCWYNLFNHHFFKESSESIFKEFLMQNGGKNMYLISDPPFGGRVEPISQTFKTISDLHKKLNKITNSEDELKIFFIFPYFMESIMKVKSNPANISGGLKDLKMTDYKVAYDNHPLFVSKDNNNKQGSQVRIFTNVPLNLIKLPETSGYKYCKRCDKWVAPENRHCKICRNCTSKDGRKYRHCKLCQRCVKNTWQHCKTCNRCTGIHKCGSKPKIGNCFKCNQPGHIEKDCSSEVPKKPTNTSKISKKRKNETENTEVLKKKKKLETSKMFSKIENLKEVESNDKNEKNTTTSNNKQRKARISLNNKNNNNSFKILHSADENCNKKKKKKSLKVITDVKKSKKVSKKIKK